MNAMLFSLTNDYSANLKSVFFVAPSARSNYRAFRRFSFKLCPVVVTQKKHVRSQNFRFLSKIFFFRIAIIFLGNITFLSIFFWWWNTIRKAQKRDTKLWFRFWVVQILVGTILQTIENPKIHFSEPRFRSFPRTAPSALVGPAVVCELLWAF